MSAWSELPLLINNRSAAAAAAAGRAAVDEDVHRVLLLARLSRPARALVVNSLLTAQCNVTQPMRVGRWGNLASLDLVLGCVGRSGGRAGGGGGGDRKGNGAEGVSVQ